MSTTILIDNGNTHNFTIKVANSDMLKTQGVCHDVNLEIQGQDFQVDLNVLPLRDCDVVLGTQRLYTLGPIQWDFKKLTMEFNLGGKEILLTGLQPSGLTLQNADQFFKLVIRRDYCCRSYFVLLPQHQCNHMGSLLIYYNNSTRFLKCLLLCLLFKAMSTKLS